MPENHYGFFFQVSNFIMQSTEKRKTERKAKRKNEREPTAV